LQSDLGRALAAALRRHPHAAEQPGSAIPATPAIPAIPAIPAQP
jgi:hypothetical protein